MEPRSPEPGGSTSGEVERWNKPGSLKPVLLALYSLGLGFFGLAALGFLLIFQPTKLDWGAVLLFAVLSLLIQRSSFHLGSQSIHSLAGVSDLAAVFALGPIGGATVAALSGFTYLALNALRHRKLAFLDLFQIPLFNAGLKVWMALAAGALFLFMSGPMTTGSGSVPMGSGVLSLPVLLGVLAVCLLWFGLDHLGWGLWEYLYGGPQQLRHFAEDLIPRAVLVELAPLPLAVVVALVYVRLDPMAFVLLAISFVGVAVLAKRWANTRNDLVQRVAELSAVELVGKAIAQAEPDEDEICQLMYEHASQIVDTTVFHLGLFEGDSFALKLWVKEGQVQPPQTFALRPGLGLVNWLRNTGQSILVSDFEKEADTLPARPAYDSEHPPRSAVFVPLMAGERVLGTLSIQSYRSRTYGDSDLRVLSAMANQAAVAIQKARLFEQERKRARQLETIAQVSLQVSAILELEELFGGVVNLLRDNFGYYHVALYTTDAAAETIEFQTSASAGEQAVTPEAEWGQGIIGWVAALGEPVLVNDVDNDHRYRCIQALPKTRSEVTVPLMLDQERVGVLDVQSDRLDAFGPDDLFILEALGRQIAIAIQKARLYEAERKQAWFSTVLLQVAEAASRLSDMDEVLTTIVRLVPILAGVDRCAILLFDPETKSFEPAQVFGLAPDLRERFERTVLAPGAMPALDLLRAEPNPLLLDGRRDEALIPRQLTEMYDIKEMLLLPLLAQGELLGAMMVDYAGSHRPFSGLVVDMLNGIANQSATVIHSARLVQSQREEAYISMALLQVADTVSRSSELAETMESITRVTPMLVGVEACTILLKAQGGEHYTALAQYGLSSKSRPIFEQLTLPKTDPVAVHLLNGEPFVSLDAGWAGIASVPAPSSALAAVAADLSLLALPLVTRGEIVGMMLVDYRGQLHHLTGRWGKILTGIASQAAVAIENDKLQAIAAQQERMEQELIVARNIQTSFLPEQCPTFPGWEMAAVWRSARQVGGDFYDFIPLPSTARVDGLTQEHMGIVIADVADKGVPAALFMALSRTLMRTMAFGGHDPKVTVARTNNLIQADARAGLFVTLFYAVLHADAGQIDFVNAGHMLPIVLRAVDGSSEELRTGGMALGVLPDEEFEQRTALLDVGDFLILYTDGVVEASNVAGEMYGKDRFIQVTSSNRSRSAGELIRIIDDEIASFVGEAAQFDDFTLVVAKRQAQEPESAPDAESIG